MTYFNPAEVNIQYDEQGKRCGAILQADNQPVESGGIGTMSKSKITGLIRRNWWKNTAPIPRACS